MAEINGASSDKINSLEIRLYELAGQWRKFHSQSKFDEASLIVDEYLKTMNALWKLGWRGDDMLPTGELPDRLMPKYFLEYWRKK